ncbi:MAG: serine hydrolase domain-containing protein [Chloroflexota bacterium]|jgi:CubicO group peptidase (beta-lactamase class C family)
MKLKALLLVFFVVAPMGMAGETAAQAENQAAIEAFLQERMESLDIPGAALTIVRGDEIVHLDGYGVANGAGEPMTPQTPFLLASFSKSMTAVAITQLVEAGEIALDNPIQQYLPWFMPDRPITIRQLLHQTSGLDEGQGYQRNLDPDGPNALEESVRKLATADLNHPPGATFEYSNSNYDVLGLLVEKVSGQPYGEYMAANLFEPLGMTNTYTSLETAQANGMSSPFYPFFGRPTDVEAILPYSRATQPSAGIIGSAEDMAHYLIMHLQDGRFGEAQIVRPASMNSMHTPGVDLNDTGLGYAMGWAVWPFDEAAEPGSPAPIALSHGGDSLGFNHIMLIVPESKLGLVLLLNTNNPTINSAFKNIAFDIALLALGQEMQNYPLEEDWLTQNLRTLGIGLILVLLVLEWIALRRLRGGEFGRRAGWLFAGLAIMDLALAGYALFIRLPNIESSVLQEVRYNPDLGLILVVVLLLTLGWGSLRSLWAWRRWRASSEG